jgi:hypothetical protein
MVVDERGPRAMCRSTSVLLLMSVLLTLSSATRLEAQAADGWRFVDDPLTNLWFHGLAVVGFYGFGPMPLYNPDYRRAARDDRRELGLDETTLERGRGSFQQAFGADSAFEILHFVPLYFYGASLDSALEALRAVAETTGGSSAVNDPAARRGARAVEAIITGEGARHTLGLFVEALAEERTTLRAIRAMQARAGESDPGRVQELGRLWREEFVPAFGGFFAEEKIDGGVVLLTPSLGAEGRFLAHRDYGALVALGASASVPAASALGALVRELCYPSVERAMAPFMGEFRDRVTAQRVNDQTATRCGELLMETRVPAHLPAYRERFGIRVDGSGPGFLSGEGMPLYLAPMEVPLEQALRREIGLSAGTGGG